MRIPYQAIKELHIKEFKKAEQPKNEKAINLVENSVGFYFNETPDIERIIKVDANIIKINIQSVKPQYESVSDKNDVLAMILIDTTGNEDFIMQKVYFADNIRNKETSGYTINLDKKEITGKFISIIYVDIFGNEFKEKVDV